MINFNEELAKYETILDVDNVEQAIKTDEIQDVLEVLQHLTSQVKSMSKE